MNNDWGLAPVAGAALAHSTIEVEFQATIEPVVFNTSDARVVLAHPVRIIRT